MNKHFLPLIISLCTAFSLSAQYPAFLENTDWFMVKNDFGQKSYFWYNTIGDTTINSLDYKIVLKDGTDVYWVREDTSTQRVYIREAVYQTDFLVYDFGLAVNNSTPIVYPGGGAFMFTCDSIDVVNTMNGPRQRLWVTGTNGGPNTIDMQWVEGVGNFGYLDGLFYLFEQGLQSDPLFQTVCAYSDAVQTYYDSIYALNQGISCPSNPNATMTAYSVVETPIEVFNIQYESLHIGMKEEGITWVEIYNLNGQLLQRKSGGNLVDMTISLEGLPSMLYTIRINTESGKWLVEKFVKE